MAAIKQLEFRIGGTGLAIGNILLIQQTTRDQLSSLFGETPRILDVGNRSDSAHKILVFDGLGVTAMYDDDKQRVLNLNIVWEPQVVDYKPANAFSGVCWLNGGQLRKDLMIEEAPLRGEIIFKKFLGDDYSAFFGNFYAQLRFANTLSPSRRARKVLASVHFSFSTANLPQSFVKERTAEQQNN